MGEKRDAAPSRLFIHQPEIGILGILTRLTGGAREYLMQAKQEPGNVDGAQVSPTLQATFSNYTQAHGGSLTLANRSSGGLEAKLVLPRLQSVTIAYGNAGERRGGIEALARSERDQDVEPRLARRLRKARKADLVE